MEEWKLDIKRALEAAKVLAVFNVPEEPRYKESELVQALI